MPTDNPSASGPTAGKAPGLEDILRLLEESLADDHLSDQERQELLTLLRTVSPPEESLRQIRNAAFALLRKRVDGTDLFHLLRWLEGIIKILDLARVPVIPLQSGAYFSPNGGCRQAILHRFAQARTKVDVCVFTISDDPIAEAMARAHRRGVKLRILTDDEKLSDAGSDVEDLKRAGIPVVIDDPGAHMHHKFAIFDDSWLITGSYNWTRSAALDNDENLIETTDPHLVRQFMSRFEALWKRYGPPI